MFIPKPRKNPYSTPRDFRPIILTSFVLKTMERLLHGVLRDEIFASVPLHPYQHAYQAGKLVETACHRLVVQVEKALDQQERALGVFLDIEGGGFSNTSYNSMCDALVRHGVDHSFVRWIRHSPMRRLVTVTVNVSSMRIAVSSVCPQGDVL